MRLLPALTSLVLLGTAPSAAAGKLWKVNHNPGSVADFTTVQAAVDAAADGDTIVIVGSVSMYAAPTLLNRALTLVGVRDGLNDPLLSGPTIVAQLAPTRSVQLSGLRLVGSHASSGLRITGCSGAVWLRSCGIDGNKNVALTLEASTAVVVDTCTVQGGHGTSFSSGGAVYGAPGSLALHMTSASRAYVYGSTLIGGTGGSDGYGSQYQPPCDGGAGAPAAEVLGGSELVLLGGSATHGVNKWIPFVASVLVADATSIVRNSDVEIVLLPGGCTGFTKYAGPHEEWAVPFRQLFTTATVLQPPGASVTAIGQFGDFALLVASADPAVLSVPGVFAPLWLGTPWFVVGAKLLPASALHVFSFPLAAPTQPGQYAPLYFQAAFADASGAALLANPLLVKVPL